MHIVFEEIKHLANMSTSDVILQAANESKRYVWLIKKHI
jgi:hypothetical protein